MRHGLISPYTGSHDQNWLVINGRRVLAHFELADPLGFTSSLMMPLMTLGCPSRSSCVAFPGVIDGVTEVMSTVSREAFGASSPYP